MAKQSLVDQQLVLDNSSHFKGLSFQIDTVVDFQDISELTMSNVSYSIGIPESPEAKSNDTHKIEAQDNSEVLDIYHDKLINFYNSEIDYRVREALCGRKPPFSNSDVFIQREREICLCHEPGMKKLTNTREKILLGMLYDKLSELREKNSTYFTLLREVKDPLLQSIALWRAKEGTIETATKEAFICGMNTSKLFGCGRRYFLYMRPLVLTEMLLSHDYPASELQEGSSYYPHLPFFTGGKKRITIKDTDREVAHALMELETGEIDRALNAARKFYLAIRPGGGSYREYKRGPYALFGNSNIGWSSHARAETLSRELTPVLKDTDTKRAIYQAAADLLNIRLGIVADNARDVKKVLKSKSSEFSLSEAQYLILRESIDRYATNQILWVWNHSAGSTVTNTRLSKAIGMRTRHTADGELEITRRVRGVRTARSIYPYTPIADESERKYASTIKPLVFTLAIINRWLDAAHKIVGESA